MLADSKHSAGGAGFVANNNARKNTQHTDRDSVDIGFFDLVGVQELERQITRASASHIATAVVSVSADDVSDHTLRDDEPFDLAKLGRGITRK